MLELAILKLFCKERSNWEKYHKLIKGLNLEKELSLLFSLIEAYYEAYPEHSYIVAQELKAFFTLEYASYKSPEILFKLIDDIFLIEISDSVIVDYVQSVIEKDTASKIINKLLKVVDESEQGLLLSIEEDLVRFKDTVKINSKSDSIFLEVDLDELIEEEFSSEGINWRLRCLQNDIGPLRGSSLVHVYARPNTGKTSFIASEITHFAKQLKDDECIIYFNNEEKGKRVLLRLFSSMLGLPIGEVVKHRQMAKEEFKRRGGDKIKMYDNAYISIEEIDRICLEHKPRIVVIDIADKVMFRGSANMDGPIRLKELYRKFRELCKVHGCDIITAGQAGAEGHGKKWLEITHMDYSKTGKGGEFDLSIGIGFTSEDGREHIRYLHINKNKLTGVHGKHSVILDSKTGRYSDMEVV